MDLSIVIMDSKYLFYMTMVGLIIWMFLKNILFIYIFLDVVIIYIICTNNSQHLLFDKKYYILSGVLPFMHTMYLFYDWNISKFCSKAFYRKTFKNISKIVSKCICNVF